MKLETCKPPTYNWMMTNTFNDSHTTHSQSIQHNSFESNFTRSNLCYHNLVRAPSSTFDEIQQPIYRKTNIIFFHSPFPPNIECKLVFTGRISCIWYWNHRLLKKGFRTEAPLSDFLVRRFELVTDGNRRPSKGTDEDLNHTVVMYWIWRFKVVFFLFTWLDFELVYANRSWHPYIFTDIVIHS